MLSKPYKCRSTPQKFLQNQQIKSEFKTHTRDKFNEIKIHSQIPTKLSFDQTNNKISSIIEIKLSII